jgi:hypothetical protein
MKPTTIGPYTCFIEDLIKKFDAIWYTRCAGVVFDKYQLFDFCVCEKIRIHSDFIK